VSLILIHIGYANAEGGEKRFGCGGIGVGWVL